jgi:hypothetical protein
MNASMKKLVKLLMSHKMSRTKLRWLDARRNCMPQPNKDFEFNIYRVCHRWSKIYGIMSSRSTSDLNCTNYLL